MCNAEGCQGYVGSWGGALWTCLLETNHLDVHEAIHFCLPGVSFQKRSFRLIGEHYFENFVPEWIIAVRITCMYVHHRNLRTRWRMHLCMQDDLTGPKPVDMARLPPSIITENIVSSKQPSLSAVTTPTLKMPCCTMEIVHFWLDNLLLRLRFLWRTPPRVQCRSLRLRF
jgi:hypothetical protein